MLVNFYCTSSWYSLPVWFIFVCRWPWIFSRDICFIFILKFFQNKRIFFVTFLQMYNIFVVKMADSALICLLSPVIIHRRVTWIRCYVFNKRLPTNISFTRRTVWIFKDSPSTCVRVVKSLPPFLYRSPRKFFISRGRCSSCPIWKNEGSGFIIPSWEESCERISNICYFFPATFNDIMLLCIFDQGWASNLSLRWEFKNLTSEMKKIFSVQILTSKLRKNNLTSISQFRSEKRYSHFKISLGEVRWEISQFLISKMKFQRI